MTMERILLKTIKFDLQVEHPYSLLLSFTKQIKGQHKIWGNNNSNNHCNAMYVLSNRMGSFVIIKSRI